MNLQTPFLIIAGLFLFVLFIRVLDWIFTPRRPKYLYEHKEFLMTGPEREFFNMLTQLVGDRFWIFPQVHLDALLNYRVKGQGWSAAFRHINEKSLDFVLCNKSDLRVAFAVELDDPSHTREDRMIRDKEVERILKDAQLPLVRIASSEATNRDLILQRINDVTKQS